MQANSETIKINNVIIFRCDEWRNGNKTEFDGHVQSVREEGVNVVYLSGYRSRNDFIPFSDIIAKLDKRRPHVELKNAPYNGRFVEFDTSPNNEKTAETGSQVFNMQANSETIKVNNVIIFRCDEWRDGNKTEFDGHVQSVREEGVDVVYLSGHRSRNDFIPFSDIIAKLDKSRPHVKLKNAPYNGRFVEFDTSPNNEKQAFEINISR